MADFEATIEEAQLVLRNDAEELARLATFVEDYARRVDLPSATVFAVQLCLDEAVSNIVRHGAGSRRATRIVVTLRRAPGQAGLLIVDDGEPFDPKDAPAPQVAASLEEAQIGGLGVHLMKKFSSAMRYERREGENHLSLTFVAS